MYKYAPTMYMQQNSYTTEKQCEMLIERIWVFSDLLLGTLSN